MMNKIGVSPSNIKDKTINVMLTEHEKSEWHNEKSAADETLRKRFKRGSLELGSEEYISYFQHREFNQREAWRPYLWQRKRWVKYYMLSFVLPFLENTHKNELFQNYFYQDLLEVLSLVLFMMFDNYLLPKVETHENIIELIFKQPGH